MFESATQQEKKTDFNEFNTDDNEPEEDYLESEVAEYFKNANVWINIQKLDDCS